MLISAAMALPILPAFKACYNRAAGQRSSGLFFKTNILPFFYLSI